MKRINKLFAFFALMGCLSTQAQITSFPYNQGFESGMDGWTVVDADADGHNWFRSMGVDEGVAAHGGSYYASSWSYDADPDGTGSAWNPNNFLISPAITVQADLSVSYWVSRTCPAYMDQYALYVCTDTTAAAIATATQLVSEVAPNGWAERTFSLDSFAGQTIYLVFRHYNSYDMCALMVDDIALKIPGEPEVDMPASLIAMLNQPLTVAATVLGATPMTYSWNSLMQASGDAVMTANNDTLTITYSNTGNDTITLIASNSHGADTATLVVTVIDVTPVTDYPYSTSFEAGDDTAWLTANGTTNGWFIGTATSNGAGSHSLYVSNDGGTSYAYTSAVESMSYVYRTFSFDSGMYTYSFDWKGHGDGSYHYLRAFIAPASMEFTADQTPAGLSDASVPTGCVALDNGYLSGSDNWHTIAGTFNIPADGNYNMVFVWINDDYSNTSTPAAVDNISVDHLTCPQPTNLAVTAATTDELTLCWTAGGSETEWAISVNNGEWDYIYTNPYTLTDLTPGTEYAIRLRAVCDVDDTSFISTVSGATRCMPIDSLPWNEGFEDYSTTTNQTQINCWDFVRSSSNSSYISIVSASNRVHTGSRSMRFSGYASTPLMAVLPPFEDPISGLELSFWCLAENTTTAGDLRVGYITDITDTTTFVQTAYISSTGHTTYTLEEVTFANAPDSARIAIQQVQNANNNYWWWIDDLDVHEAPECTRPVGLTVSNVTSTGATFTVNDPAMTGSYHFIVMQGTDTIVNETLYDSVITIDTLTPGTNYTASVSTICYDGTETTTIGTSFATGCAPIATLPWTEGFEDYTTTTNQTQINCWDFVRSSSNSSYISIVSASNRVHTGSRSMRFSGYASTPLMAVLPPFEDPISGLELSFWCLAENTTTAGDLRVGYITDITDTTTFVQTAYISSTGHTTYTLEEVTFANAPDSARIAIQQVQNANNNYWWWIDDLDVHEAPECSRPTSVSVADITENEATVTINDIAWAGNYHLVILSGTDTVVNETIYDTSFYIDTLAPATNYTVIVSTICPDGTETSTISTSFNTACGVVSSFPWYEDFNSDASWTCWSTYNFDNNDNSDWSRNSNGYAVSGYNDEGNANDWLITPAIVVPYNANGLSLTWKAYGDSYSTDFSHLTVRLSTQGTDTASFTTVLSSATLPDDVWTTYSASLSAYAGDTVRIAFIHDSYNDDGPRIDSVGVRFSLMPRVLLPATAYRSNVGETLGLRAILSEGDSTGLVYSWSNTLAGSTLTTLGDSVNIAYTAAGIDTITVVATNSHGSDTAHATVTVLNCTVVSTFPFTEGFESSDLGCWSTIDANNDGHDWYFGSEVSSIYTSYATPHSGNECLISESYTMTSSLAITPDNYLVSPAIALPATGTATLTWYDYSYASYPAEHYSVYVSTTGATAADFLATTAVFDTTLSSDTAWHLRSVDLSSYAGQTIHIAFRHHDCYDEYFLALDDITVSYDSAVAPVQYTVSLTTADATMGTVSPAGVTTVNEGDNFTATATANSGYHFVAWMSGTAQVSTNNPYTFAVTANTSLTATFEADTQEVVYYTVAVNSADETMGTVSSTATGSVAENTSITVTAQANEGFHFVNWTNQDDYTVSTTESYTFVVTANITLTANFAADTTPQPDCLTPTQVAASNVTANSAVISWTANGNESRWLIDFNGQQVTADSNPFTLTGLSPNTTYAVKVQALCSDTETSEWSEAASFTTLQLEGIDDVNGTAITLYPNPATTVLTLSGINGHADVTIMDVNGRTCGKWVVENGSTTLDISRLAQGAYFVRITGDKVNATRKLVVK